MEIRQSETMLEKLEKTKPYNIFFTKVLRSPTTFKQSNTIKFTDLLCPSLGVLKCSLQINFMLNRDWIIRQYDEKNLSHKPLTILYGTLYEPVDSEEIANELFWPNVTLKLIKLKSEFGVHHSKIAIHVYEDDSIRVIVSTANLYSGDWTNYSNGVWVSPRCPKISDDCLESDGESSTHFKAELLGYLRKYKILELEPYIKYVQKCDFTSVRVFLIYSFPGVKYPKKNGSHLHYLESILTRNCSLPQNEDPLAWKILVQSSSLGFLGKNPNDWFESVLVSLASTKGPPKPTPECCVIYPSRTNVEKGYYGKLSGGCLMYLKNVHDIQKHWFQDHLYQWKADALERTRSMPHIKTYCRISPCLNKLAYFLLTSANFSRNAWGGTLGKRNEHFIRSFEVGVLFLPKYFDEEYFEITDTLDRKNKTVFPFIYDLPLTQYDPNDAPHMVIEVESDE